MSPLRCGLAEGRAVSLRFWLWKGWLYPLLSVGLPEGKAVSPLSPGLLEERVVSPLRFQFPDGDLYLPLTVILKGRAVSLHRLGLPEVGVVFSLRVGLPEPDSLQTMVL